MENDSITRVYSVTGMTCDHCVAAVRQEIEALPGVRSVSVDLAAGRVTVEGGSISDAAVHGAVDEAGYEVVV